jgi:acylphosphatase
MASFALRLVIRGRVQGIGYRWWAMQQAEMLGLSGWVRNRRDGSVELLAIGSETACAQLAAACAYGPPAASVTAVESSPAEDDGSRRFEARKTV